MAVARRLDAQVAILLVGFSFLACVANGASRGHLFGAGAPRRSLADTTEPKIFDVTTFGAKPEASASPGRKMTELPGGGDPESLPELPVVGGKDEGGDEEKDDGPNPDGNNENGMAFIRTWVAACRGQYKGPAKVVIPKGTFVTGPVVFQGPCTSSSEPIIVEVQGEVKATTDMSDYPTPEWFSFEMIDGLILTGGGVFNGQGEKIWNKNGCGDGADCPQAPSNIKVMKVKNALIEGITSLNSKYFHYHITDSSNVTMNNVQITAPGDSPNTDGAHISTSDNVHVINSVIGTGDDCVSIGQGTSQIIVNNITCGPGHGISVGSLGKYKNELPVKGITVSNCTMLNTTNGARIKTWAGPNGGEASGIIFDNIVLDHVKAPIVIDQHYGTKKTADKNSGKQSLYKISDVHFRNIRGTSSFNMAVSLACSATNPCDGVELTNIDIAYAGISTKNAGIASECFNANIALKGTMNPPAPACQ